MVADDSEKTATKKKGRDGVELSRASHFLFRNERRNLSRTQWFPEGDNLVIHISIYGLVLLETFLCVSPIKHSNSVYSFPIVPHPFTIGLINQNTISGDYKVLMALIINNIS